MIRLWIVMATLLAVADAVAAQSKADFSGDWTLNRDASVLSPDGGRRLRATEGIRGAREHYNVWIFDRRPLK